MKFSVINNIISHHIKHSSTWWGLTHSMQHQTWLHYNCHINSHTDTHTDIQTAQQFRKHVMPYKNTSSL